MKYHNEQRDTEIQVREVILRKLQPKDARAKVEREMNEEREHIAKRQLKQRSFIQELVNRKED